jgi:cytochrome c
MKTAAALLTLLLLPAAAPAVPAGATLARGKALFESKALGTNGKACVLCHAGGNRFKEVAETDDAALADYVNSCIKGMLAGKPLAPSSDDLRSLLLYVRSLAPPGK